jgi:two-component sensor histidine kinase
MTGSVQQVFPPNEAQRLSALHRYEILDTPAESTFDRITSMAARIFSVPIAVISLVDESRIWFKSHHGVNVREITRDPGLCASAILQEEPWILANAREDERSRHNTLVTSDFGLQFYVGIPLRTKDGFNIGMLCVLDQEPHEVSEAQIADLKDLAAIVMEQMELRLSTRNAIASTARLIGEREVALEMAGLIAREYSDSVENSLELITGLLRHQSLTEGTPDAAQLAFTANRVAAVRQAHRHISAGGGTASVTAFLRDLCHGLCDAGEIGGIENIRVEGAELSAASRPLIAIGLVVNELVALAAERGAKRVQILLERRPEGYALSVADDGAPVPAAFDPSASEDFGMKIVRGQLQHIAGRILAERESAIGARFTVYFLRSL